MSSPLEQEIRELIQRQGRITFADYMRLALYHPIHGYYADPSRGPGFDYRTSPTLTPSFGALMARLLFQMWHSLTRPEPFTVLEIGGGAGALAQAGIQSSSDGFVQSLVWEFVEPFPAMRSAQRQKAAASISDYRFRESLVAGPAVDGCILANEVLDNFPVHLFEVTAAVAQEVYVTAGTSGFEETLGRPSAPGLGRAADEAASYLADGDRFEICGDLDDWANQAFHSLLRGYLLVLDYGDFEPQIYEGRPAGTLITYEQERIGGSPLAHPGTKDITAHVNFTQLVGALERAGFEEIEVTTQGELLRGAGADQAAADLRVRQRFAEAEGRHGDALGLLAERGRLSSLVSPGALGDHLALVASKGAPRTGRSQPLNAG